MILFLLILIVIIAACLFTYSIAFYSPKHKRPTMDTPIHGKQYDAVAEHIHRISHIMSQYPFEEITISAFDGTLLYGRYYHLKDGAPLQILFHGYRSHAYRDCAGGHVLARKMGFNTLVIDQRAQGKSGGHTITFGIKERRDCLSWVQYATDRFGADTPILLSGLSMGAATVLMASDLNLPQNVCCILADSPYSTPSAIIEKVAADRHYPVALCRPFLHLSALLFGGFLLNIHTAKESVRHAHIPVLLLHGEDDRLVPYSMSLEIAACCASRVQVVTFPGAGHGLCYISDPGRYERVVLEFLISVPALEGRINKAYIASVYDNP